MAVGALEETVIVTEATPTIDVQSVRQTETIDREVFEVLPTTRGYDSLALLIPAMNIQGGPSTAVPIDTGGLSGVPNNRLTIHGSDEYDAEVHVDGFDVNSVAFDGAPGALPQDTAIAEYVYDYSSNAAEVETGGVRMNMIPKEGSNQFTGSFYANYGHSSWLANNVDQDLIDRGITGGKDGAFRADQTWQVAPSLGGPLVRDHLWFYASYTYRRASFFPSGLFNSSDTSALTYVPDLDNPTLEVSNNYEYTGRLTWQASERNKIQAYYANSNVKQTPALTGSQLYPLYIAPEAGTDGTSAFNTYQLTWVRPHTDRILFEAGYSRLPAHSVLYPLNNEFGAPGLGAHFDARTDLPGLLELSTLTMSRNMGGLFQGNTVWFSTVNHTARASMSYVTGSHNLKFGFRTTLKWQNESYRSGANWTNVQHLLRQPGAWRCSCRDHPSTNQLTNTGHLRAGPVDDRPADDQRRACASTTSTASTPTRCRRRACRRIRRGWQHAIMIDGGTAASWKDLQPRLGVVYDLRGDGRTALKASASRFGSRDAISLAGELNPIANNTDARLGCGATALPFNHAVSFGGRRPVSVLLRRRRSASPAMGFRRAIRTLPHANGELIASPPTTWCSARTPSPSASIPRGRIWLGPEEGQLGVLGERPARAARQRVAGRRLLPAQLHQLRCLGQPGGRRRGLRRATPSWSRRTTGCPAAGGYPLTVVDMTPEAFARAQDNVKTGTNNLGGESEMWHGIDISMNARLEERAAAGRSGHRAENLPTTAATRRSSRRSIWSEFSAYPASRVGRGNHRAARRHRRQPGQPDCPGLLPGRGQLADQRVAVGFVHVPLRHRHLGRVLLAARTAARGDLHRSRPTEAVGGPRARADDRSRSAPSTSCRPGTVFGDRLNQLDLRFAKLLDFGTGGNVRASFDIYNLFNANAVSREVGGFGPVYLQPVGLQPAVWRRSPSSSTSSPPAHVGPPAPRAPRRFRSPPSPSVPPAQLAKIHRKLEKSRAVVLRLSVCDLRAIRDRRRPEAVDRS